MLNRSVVRFSKYEGLGNDFVVVDGRSEDLALAARHAVALCDRHRGIGADGVLLVEWTGGKPAMRVINSDGSRPEMCGNGVRCVALYLAHSGFGALPLDVEIDTDSGPHHCRVFRHGDRELVEVSMRPASLVPAEIGVSAPGPVLDGEFEVDGTHVRLSCVSMGNPHAVTFDDIGAARATLGPRLGTHARFANGANIGFARIVGPQRIELAVFERGAGFTQACGTGACAAAVAAVETGRAQRGQPIEVQLPGGPLTLLVRDPSDRVLMTGPARRVFQGEVELD
ncbi:MAG TPA: diaminopimelate epimerase [Polyangiales bacterium]|nr:diaminopimelate epimerase [Polyangiales bacterium]